MSKFREFIRREIGEIVRCLRDQNKNKISAVSQPAAMARTAPKICYGQPPTMYSECSRFHPNRFTFGGVIAERVNTVFAPKSKSIIQIFKCRSSLVYCYYYYYLKCTYLSDTVTQNAAGALYTVNKVPAYNIGGNSELATSGTKNSSEKKCFQFSSEGGERRCSLYGRRQTVVCPWSGDREWSVAHFYLLNVTCEYKFTIFFS